MSNNIVKVPPLPSQTPPTFPEGFFSFYSMEYLRFFAPWDVFSFYFGPFWPSRTFFFIYFIFIYFGQSEGWGGVEALSPGGTLTILLDITANLQHEN